MPLLLLVALARRRLLARAAVLPLILAILSIPACVILVGKAEVSSVDASTPVTLTTPVKAHLRDGSTVLYRRGVTVTAESLAGPGTRYGLTLADSAPVTAVAIADVATPTDRSPPTTARCPSRARASHRKRLRLPRSAPWRSRTARCRSTPRRPPGYPTREM